MEASRAPSDDPAACELCAGAGGALLWRDALCRVVRVDEPAYPGFCRVILERHAREMTDLVPAEREAVMRVVFAVEEAVREAMRPEKVNLASLGNQTPHVHWHIVPRFRDDPHFPTPIWGPAQREGTAPGPREAAAVRIPGLLRERLGAGQ